MRGETDLGWDATKNTIIADDDWWVRKLKENARYKKFRNKDLSLIWFRYDALFADVVATGERARATNQEQSSGIGLNLDEEGINDINGCDKEHFTLINDEMSDESDDLQNINSVMFPESSLKRQKSTDGVSTSSQVRKKKKTAAPLIKEDIHSLIEFMSSKSTATSPAVDETSIEKCIGKLEQIPNILAGSEIYSFTMNMFRKKNNRQIFFGMPTDEARKSWLKFNYQLYLKKNG
ncbi:L10-interacting MYB domain-containing protein-like [Nicotiana tabacum]|uniref:L10-interacting MYB domain-containing protein-like n=1 Tax=Nicotiana tabacum TaxID=4097 RepID=A0A1S3ZT06_TOBAC|nr:PREDICTED: L10-interacting MYB domain-containing protein-like [Nicotiana tabacum]